MQDIPAKVMKLEPKKGQRILVVSDVHGNLKYLKGVLNKAGFSSNDILIIDGDFLEKGPESLNTLRFIMELSKGGNVYPIVGNCDFWYVIYDDEIGGSDDYTENYVFSKRSGIVWEMINAAGINPFEVDSFEECKEAIYRKFRKEWDYMASLPQAIETDKFMFAHACIHPDKPLKEHTFWELLFCDAFLQNNYCFKDKWAIVGHWPVALYSERIKCSNPIIDYSNKVISIDGGCVLEKDGQLNALLIPDKDSEDFGWYYYDPFPEYRVKSGQAGGGTSYNIRWGDSRVKVLQRGEEFSRVIHIRTGYEMDILTSYLFSDNEETDCVDYTDYVLPLHKGDLISVIETTSRGYYAKHNGVTGWYYGELE